MIFAIATDDRTLTVFPDPASAIAYCEGIDVEDGVWLFWGPDGESLEAAFSQPNERGHLWVASGVYSLRPSANGKSLLESLEGVGDLEPNPHFSSLDAVVEHLAQCNKAKHHRA